MQNKLGMMVLVFSMLLILGCEKTGIPDRQKDDMVELSIDLQLGTPRTRYEPILPPSDNSGGSVDFVPFPSNQDYYPFFDFGMFVCEPYPINGPSQKRQYKPDFINSDLKKDDIAYSSLVESDYNLDEKVEWYKPQLNHYNNFKAQFNVPVLENKDGKTTVKWEFNFTNFERDKLFIRSDRESKVFAYYPFTYIPNPSSVTEGGQSGERESVYYQNPQYVPVISGYHDYLVAEPLTIKKNEAKAGVGTYKVVLKFHHVFTCIQVNMYAKHNVGTPEQGFVYLKSMTLHDAKADSDSSGRLSKGGWMDITELDDQNHLPIRNNFYDNCNSTESITSINKPMSLAIPTLKEYNDAKKHGEKLPSATIFIAMPQPEYLKDGAVYEKEDMYLTFKYAVRKDPDLPIDLDGDEDKEYIDGIDKFYIPKEYIPKGGGDKKPMKLEPGHRYIFNIVIDNSVRFAPISQEDCWIEEEEIEIKI